MTEQNEWSEAGRAQRRSEILDKIWQSMELTFDDMHHFTDDPSKKKIAEYLFTVNLAKSIDSDLNGPEGDPYFIHIEEETGTFANHCLRPYAEVVTEDGSRRFRVRSKVPPLISRRGKIDVAVYRRSVPQIAECAIEVKGFDPARSKVLADLKRNAEFMRIVGNTGVSRLSFTAFASLYSFQWAGPDTSKREAQLKRKYSGWLASLADLRDLSTSIEVRTLRNIQGVYRSEGGDDDEVFDETAGHHFLGVLVSFCRPPKK